MCAPVQRSQGAASALGCPRGSVQHSALQGALGGYLYIAACPLLHVLCIALYKGCRVPQATGSETDAIRGSTESARAMQQIAYYFAVCILTTSVFLW
jgi:hypothetical protein